MTPVRCCVIIPTYNNPQTIERVVEQVRALIDAIIVVDDGSAALGRLACKRVQDRKLATVIRHEQNAGKGAAVKTGFLKAIALGYTHAFQIDADGQHDIGRIPGFVAAAQQSPASAIFGYPLYNGGAPINRLLSRKITNFWVNFELKKQHYVKDAMIGFRIYPLQAVTEISISSDRMDFDIEIAVRLSWAGVSFVNLPVGVRYLSKEEGGKSDFQPIRDNLRFAWLHSRLCTEAATRWCVRKLHLLSTLGAS